MFEWLLYNTCICITYVDVNKMVNVDDKFYDPTAQ